MKPIDKIAKLVLCIGGINWGLVGLFNFDLVATLFGAMSFLSRSVYVAVALSAVYVLAKCMMSCSQGACSIDKGNDHNKGGCCS
jgi:uncharacterized membrane protein YuzA (DUF378 family)